MAIARATNIDVFAQALADELRETSSVREIFIEPDEQGGVLWLLSDAVDDAEHDAYYDAFVTIFRRWPETQVDFHVVSPDDFPPGTPLIEAAIPRQARPIELRR